MSNNNTDRLPCTVECEHCGELLCSDSTTTLCCAREKATPDGCTIPMWECAGCKAEMDAQTAEELELVRHPASRAAIVADRANKGETMFEDEETETRRIDIQSMREMVYGKPAPRRFHFPARLIFVVAVLSAAIGCATGAKPVAVEVETVGQLSASYHSVAVAPVHAATDLTPSFGAVDTDEEAPAKVSVRTEAVDAPEVVQKSDGLKTGEVR
jgi:hypothetical protein